jgi:hypothetical protein
LKQKRVHVGPQLALHARRDRHFGAAMLMAAAKQLLFSSSAMRKHFPHRRSRA